MRYPTVARTKRRGSRRGGIALVVLLILALGATACSTSSAKAPGARGGAGSASASASGHPEGASPSGHPGGASPSPSSAVPGDLGSRRIVAYYGAPGSGALGVLGESSPDGIWPRLRDAAKTYAAGSKPAVPAYEVISSVANATPGPDGTYRSRLAPAQIKPYITAARKHHALVVLDIQPGTANFLSEAKALSRWLAYPEVGLALDPEWHMKPGETPGQTIGSVTSSEVNQVSSWLSGFTAAHMELSI